MCVREREKERERERERNRERDREREKKRPLLLPIRPPSIPPIEAVSEQNLERGHVLGYRGTSPIRKRPSPEDPHRTLDRPTVGS